MLVDEHLKALASPQRTQLPACKVYLLKQDVQNEVEEPEQVLHNGEHFVATPDTMV